MTPTPDHPSLSTDPSRMPPPESLETGEFGAVSLTKEKEIAEHLQIMAARHTLFGGEPGETPLAYDQHKGALHDLREVMASKFTEDEAELVLSYYGLHRGEPISPPELAESLGLSTADLTARVFELTSKLKDTQWADGF